MLTIVAVAAVAVVAMDSRERVDQRAHEMVVELSELGPELGTPADVFSKMYTEAPRVGNATITQVGNNSVTVSREVSTALAQRCVTVIFEAASLLDDLQFSDGSVDSGAC